MKKLHGIYLVLDPSQEWGILLKKLHSALKGGVQIIQIWNHWEVDISQAEKLRFINRVKELAQQFHVSVLMHEDYELALEADLDGVHFDHMPKNFESIKNSLKGKYIGMTVGNDPNKIAWADKQKLAYISFCSMFPSSSVTSCEIVDQQSVIKAREITDLPIFLSGGISPHNLKALSQLPFSGVAIISGIMSSDNPERAVRQYLAEIENIQYQNNLS